MGWMSLLRMGGPPNPPLPPQGWMSHLRMGGTPKPPPLPCQGWMSPLRMGGPPKPPTPAPGVDVVPSNGGDPPTPPLPRQGWMSHLRMGGTLQTPHSRAILAMPKLLTRIPAKPKHFTRHSKRPFLIPQSPRCARGLITFGTSQGTLFRAILSQGDSHN